MPPFRLGIIILAHRRHDQLAVLVEALRHPQVTVYLHIDRRSRIKPFQEALATVGDGSGVVWLKRHRSAWGTLGIVDAELEGISRALADGCSYVMLISGEDFPLRPVEEIVEFAQANRERSFVDGARLPYDRWEFSGRGRTDFYSYRLLGALRMCIPRGEDTSHLDLKQRALNVGLRGLSLFKPARRFPPYLEAYGTQQWINLSAAACRYVLDFVRLHPDYHRYHRHTAFPDEIYIQSILLGSDFADSHEVVADDLRFLIWGDGAHPEVLTAGDLPAMLAGSDLFARKVIADQEPELFAALCRNIELDWPAAHDSAAAAEVASVAG
jgi:hypothetical protein